ncbi:hypothetical protein L484_014688 [Morus notabilis]|uniref:Uncharacterized protein n=1 Tax=Morus notabilis TaxID=981085 RepID=W9SJS8_9ROSA|nr:hypothetical protein L484_014688 [Morus notabilis]
MRLLLKSSLSRFPPDKLLDFSWVPKSLNEVAYRAATWALREAFSGHQQQYEYLTKIPADIRPQKRYPTKIHGGIQKTTASITDHVAVGEEVVANVEDLDLTELAEILEDVLVEVIEVLLDLALVDRLALSAGTDLLT